MSKYTRVFDNDEIQVDRDERGNYRVSFFEDYHWKDEYFYYKSKEVKEKKKKESKKEGPNIREIEIPYSLPNHSFKWAPNTTNTFTFSNIPNCCKNCKNHPSNGGSGVCNCTAPLFGNSDPYKITC